MIDLACPGETMGRAGGEDRALLRSNSSAHAGAGTWAEVDPPERPLPPFTTCSGQASDKPRGSGGSAPRSPATRTDATIVKIAGAGQSSVQI